MKGWIISRKTSAGQRWDARWRLGSKEKSRSFQRRKDAERFLSAVVTHVHQGGYIDVKPLLMDKVFDQWLVDLDTRVREGSIKRSTSKSYRSMVEEHLRPAFGHVRSDHLAVGIVEAWRTRVTEKIEAGKLTGKTFSNLRNLLHAIADWARHPSRSYLAHDPLAGLPRLRISRQRVRPFFEPDAVAKILSIATPPNDTIIRVAALSGLRRGELFALQWNDIDWNGQIHVRRRIYQGDIDEPKTDSSSRMIDVPQRVLDDLLIHREMFPPVGDGFVFRTGAGAPLDPDNWQKRVFVPILKHAGLYRLGVGLHACRHGYVSLLARLGEDPHYISRQAGHSSVRLTQDIYRHTFAEARSEAMRKLDDAFSGNSVEPAETGENTRNSREVEPQ